MQERVAAARRADMHVCVISDLHSSERATPSEGQRSGAMSENDATPGRRGGERRVEAALGSVTWGLSRQRAASRTAQRENDAPRSSKLHDKRGRA
jgi:hypothetical protein